MLKTLFLSIIILLTFPSCAYKKFSRNIVAKSIKHSIFISMTENPLVFDNLSSDFYTSLFRRYNRVGYNLSINKDDSFILTTKLKKLDSVENIISQDLLLYNVRIALIVECSLFDLNKKEIKKKEFTFYRLVSLPYDPLNNTAFFDFEYKRLINSSVISIEHFFRKFLIKTN